MSVKTMGELEIYANHTVRGEQLKPTKSMIIMAPAKCPRGEMEH